VDLTDFLSLRKTVRLPKSKLIPSTIINWRRSATAIASWRKLVDVTKYIQPLEFFPHNKTSQGDVMSGCAALFGHGKPSLSVVSSPSRMYLSKLISDKT
jgi:hypothetical protein